MVFARISPSFPGFSGFSKSRKSLVFLAFSLVFVRADFWEGDATKHFSVKKRGFQRKGGGNSVNHRFGEEFLQERQFSEEVRAIH